MNPKVFLFGGTSEGRRLALWLARNGVSTRMFVEASCGEIAVPPAENLVVTLKRLNSAEIAREIAGANHPLVIDATHPYAREITSNVRAACDETGAERLRLVREKWLPPSHVVAVENTKQAAALLNRNAERALLVVDSKELEAFTRVKNFRERLYARVLLSVEAIQKCASLGFSGNRLICMQGPFSRELNAEIIRATGAKFLVTKNADNASGLYEKVEAARETGCKVILIEKPKEPERGLSYGRLAEELTRRFGLGPEQQSEIQARPPQTPALRPYFPLFVRLTGKQVVVVGGGAVATRRVRVLLRFGALIRIISPQVTPELMALADAGKVLWEQKCFLRDLIIDADLVIAATNMREVNGLVAETAKKLRILCSVVDSHEKCTFLFPAVTDTDHFVAGIVSSDNDHESVRKITEVIRKYRGTTP